MDKKIRDRAIEELNYLFNRYKDAAEMFGMYDEILEEDPVDINAKERRDYYRDECFKIDSRMISIKRVYGLL